MLRAMRAYVERLLVGLLLVFLLSGCYSNSNSSTGRQPARGNGANPSDTNDPYRQIVPVP